MHHRREAAAARRRSLKSSLPTIVTKTLTVGPLGSASAATGWARFWAGRVDLDALGWEVTAMLEDITAADKRHADTTRHAMALWQRHWPDDRWSRSLGSDRSAPQPSGGGGVKPPTLLQPRPRWLIPG